MRDYRFGNFLRELRERCGLSQYQLGTLVGVSDKAVSKWENGTSKPKSRLLYPLGEVLGVRVDELLACGYHTPDNPGKKGGFAMTNDLWNKARDALYEKYSACPPPEFLNRYFSEYEEFREGDAVVFYDFLGRLSDAAKKKNEYIQTKGTLGSSFTAYLLGATDVHPLEAHVYCPRCRTVRFAENVPCGWDLPEERCSCGGMLVRDGQDIPFESLRRGAEFRSEYISVPRNFYGETLDFMKIYFRDCKIVSLEREEDGVFAIFVILPGDISGYTDGQTLPFREYNQKLRSYPRLMISCDERLDAVRMLGERTGYPYDRVDFLAEDVLTALCSGEVDGIPEFDSRLIRSVLTRTKPKTRFDLLQVCGLMHDSGAWFDNAEVLLSGGHSLSEIVAYREDVFRYVQNRMKRRGVTGTGLAYRVTENARLGRYAKDGMPPEEKQMLLSVGAETWFADSLEKMRYLFPKAHGVEYVRYAMILTWYRLRFPKDFAEVCGKAP